MPMEDRVRMYLESDQFSCAGVHVRRIEGREAISQLFRFDIDVSCTDARLDPKEVTGTEARLVFKQGSEVLRTVHGMICYVEEHIGFGHDDNHFLLRLVPRAHRLTLVKTQDIFLDFSVPALIEHKLQLVGLEELDLRMTDLIGEYAKREFIVQYDETDLAFITRLAEHIGLSFHFDQSGDGDTMVFTDSNSAFTGSQEPLTLTLRERKDEIGLHEIKTASQVIPAFYVEMDYNYRTPHVDLTTTQESDKGFGGGVAEWGAHYKTPAEGESMARVRAEERECTAFVYQGKSDVPQVSAGHHAMLDGHDRLDSARVLVAAVEHRGSQPDATEAAGEEASYHNTFTAVPAIQTYRTPRVTPKPKIPGLMTGVVEPLELGRVEDYARIDEHGRYRIKFLFDTVPIGERQASRPVRKAQPTVGADYGMHFPLRPGIEVVMGFVNGDPDRPIVVGAVHNAHTPAHVKDKNSRQNIIKTASGIVMKFKDN